MNYLKLPVLLFLILFTSCRKGDDIRIAEKNKPYVMEDIQWVLKEGDGQKILEIKRPDELVTNNGSGLIHVTFNPLKNMEGSSHFQFELPEGLSLNQDSLLKLVSVPAHIELLSDNYAHIGGGTKVPFRREESSFPFSFKSEESFEVTPKTQINYQSTVFLRKNTATFKARFVQPVTKERFELTGKWTGTFYESVHTNAVVDDLD